MNALRAIEVFRRAHDLSLSPTAKSRINTFLKSRLAGAARDPSIGPGGAREVLVALAALEAQITFLLSGRQEQIRARSERALLHLQRVLVVDEDVRAK